MMVGNGVTNWAYDTMPATLDMGYWRSIVGQDLHDQITALKCNYSLIDFGEYPSDECMDLLDQVSTNIEYLNIYNIYSQCYGGANVTQKFSNDIETVRNGGKSSVPKKGFTARDYTPWMYRSRQKKTLVRSTEEEERPLSDDPDLGPCTFGIPLMDFLDDPEVRTQMHIPEYIQPWTMCKDNFNYTMQKNATQSIWDNPDLYNKYRMMKYSGDKDACVPTIGSLGWILSLNRAVKEDWRTWYVNHETTSVLGGYTQEFDGLTFITVHGAGHMVPQDQREAAFVMVNTFMAGEGMPKRNDTQPSMAEPTFIEL